MKRLGVEKMDWSKEEVLVLVDLVRRRPALYDEEKEGYHNSKVKSELARELASIISSTRPGTTAQDVQEKWDKLCSAYITFHKKLLSKKKSTAKPYFIDKMDFMSPYLNLPLLNPMSRKSIKGNHNITNESPDGNKRLSQGKDKYPCLTLSRVETSAKNDIGDEENDSAPGGQDQESVCAISIHSDTPTEPTPILNHGRKRRHSTISLATTHRDISSYTMESPLVNVTDSILNRTEPCMSEYQSYVNGSNLHMSKETLSADEDEDLLYVRYIACKLKKLEDSQKLQFKLKLEKLFFESMNQ